MSNTKSTKPKSKPKTNSKAKSTKPKSKQYRPRPKIDYDITDVDPQVPTTDEWLKDIANDIAIGTAYIKKMYGTGRVYAQKGKGYIDKGREKGTKLKEMPYDYRIKKLVREQEKLNAERDVLAQKKERLAEMKRKKIDAEKDIIVTGIINNNLKEQIKNLKKDIKRKS